MNSLTENIYRYLALLGPESIVCELGPGTGRLSRHIVGHCGKLIGVDNSAFVCKWLPGYLSGRGVFEVHQLQGQSIPLQDESVDRAVSHGVVEHLDFDELFWFLSEFHRVLRPDGCVLFNFVDPTTAEGVDLFLRTALPGERSIFRLHHPAMIQRLAELAGFQASISHAGGRVSLHLELSKG